MPEALLFFSLASCISFIGSLQPGPTNMFILQRAAQGHHTIFASVGGSLPEILYCSLAIWFSSVIEQLQATLIFFRILIILFFLISGIYLLYQKNKKKPSPGNVSSHAGKAFVSAFMIALLNPLLLVFWISILSYLQVYNISPIHSVIHKMAFIAGSAAGAFILLQITAIFAKWIRNRFSSVQRTINLSIGVLFILLAGKEILQLVYSLT